MEDEELHEGGRLATSRALERAWINVRTDSQREYDTEEGKQKEEEKKEEEEEEDDEE